MTVDGNFGGVSGAARLTGNFLSTLQPLAPAAQSG